jgi:hypothetical protein
MRAADGIVLNETDGSRDWPVYEQAIKIGRKAAIQYHRKVEGERVSSPLWVLAFTAYAFH